MDRIRVAKFIFSLDAVLGILSVGGAALYGAAYASGNMWTTFFAIFVPFAVLWALICYTKVLRAKKQFSNSCSGRMSWGMCLAFQLEPRLREYPSGFGVT